METKFLANWLKKKAGSKYKDENGQAAWSRVLFLPNINLKVLGIKNKIYNLLASASAHFFKKRIVTNTYLK